ncbi:unnamed protein product, partial [marine sediment metagenome]
MGNIEEYAVAPHLFHLGKYAARYNITGRKLSLRGVIVHELATIGIAQDAPLTPHRLGDKE